MSNLLNILLLLPTEHPPGTGAPAVLPARCQAAGNAPLLHKNEQFTFSEFKQSKEVRISMTRDHVYIFKGVKKAKVLLKSTLNNFCPPSEQPSSIIRNMYKQHWITHITFCKDTGTPYVDFCVVMATPTAPREATWPATCAFKPAPSQNDSPGQWYPGKFTTRFFLL